MNVGYGGINVGRISGNMFKRWWLILVCLVALTGMAWYLSNYFVAPVYKAETTLFLGKEENSASITITDLQINNQLVVDYREIIKSRLVLDDVIQKLKLGIDYETFARRVQVTTIKDSRIFKISYENGDPHQAATVANQLASAIIEKAAQIFNVKNVQLIDLAYAPDHPIKPDKLTYCVTGGALGILLGVFLSLFAEFSDRTLKRPEDVERHLGLSVMGTIPKVKSKFSDEVIFAGSSHVNFSKDLVVYHQPRSYASEAYRTLQANIQNNEQDRPVKTLMIAGSATGEGKSVTAANLALSFAHSGERVLLVDADLRNPSLHEYFGVVNDTGLSDILSGMEPVSCIKQFEGVSNLFLISAGPARGNLGEILSVRRLRVIFEGLKNQFDMIIIDTPPVGQVTDPIIIGGIADIIVMVLSSGETEIKAAKQAKKALQTIGNGRKLIGISFYKFKAKDAMNDSGNYVKRIS